MTEEKIRTIGKIVCIIAIIVGMIGLGMTIQQQIDKNFVSYCNKHYGLNNYTLETYNCGLTICYKCVSL